MPASFGGSVVDQSLLRQASDRGVTICFADLDGADGLWVPEERTVLVSRRLSEQEVAEVIEHELAHVMIDDQHADLDAGRDVLVGRPPLRSRRWVAALAAAGLVAVVGGVTVGIAKVTGGPVKKEQVVAPTAPGTLTAQESGQPAPGTTVIPSRGPDGRIVYRTVVVTATPPLPTSSASPAGSLAPTPTASAAPPARSTVAGPPAAQSVSPTAPPVQVTLNPPSPSSTPEPPATTEPVPTDPAGASESGAAGQTDAGTASDVADAPSVDVSDVAAAGSGAVGPIVDPTG
jgi:hypothetical protein